MVMVSFLRWVVVVGPLTTTTMVDCAMPRRR
jgi:hypothetical protein